MNEEMNEEMGGEIELALRLSQRLPCGCVLNHSFETRDPRAQVDLGGILAFWLGERAAKHVHPAKELAE